MDDRRGPLPWSECPPAEKTTNDPSAGPRRRPRSPDDLAPGGLVPTGPGGRTAVEQTRVVRLATIVAVATTSDVAVETTIVVADRRARTIAAPVGRSRGSDARSTSIQHPTPVSVTGSSVARAIPTQHRPRPAPSAGSTKDRFVMQRTVPSVEAVHPLPAIVVRRERARVRSQDRSRRERRRQERARRPGRAGTTPSPIAMLDAAVSEPRSERNMRSRSIAPG